MKKKIIRECALPAIGLVVLLGSACDTAEKKAHTTPVPQAQAPTIAQSEPAPAPAPVPVVSQAPKAPDPVDKMIEDAEKQYQQGQQEYAAGHLEAAKVNFDQAVNVLLEGSVDVRADER